MLAGSYSLACLHAITATEGDGSGRPLWQPRVRLPLQVSPHPQGATAFTLSTWARCGDTLPVYVVPSLLEGEEYSRRSNARVELLVAGAESMENRMRARCSLQDGTEADTPTYLPLPREPGEARVVLHCMSPLRRGARVQLASVAPVTAVRGYVWVTPLRCPPNQV